MAIACLVTAVLVAAIASVVQGEHGSSLRELDGNGRLPGIELSDNAELRTVYVPLSWAKDRSGYIGRQGTTYLWGTCGECAVANTLNTLTGAGLTEQDLVDHVVENGECDEVGGMTVNDMVRAYMDYLPAGASVYAYFESQAITNMEDFAEMLDKGRLLNVSVYGEMQRQGGHTGEGDIYGTHWLVLTRAVRDAAGNLEGFDILDSASSQEYISASQLRDIYLGHDGTNILDPTCIQVYGWGYDLGDGSIAVPRQE